MRRFELGTVAIVALGVVLGVGAQGAWADLVRVLGIPTTVAVSLLASCALILTLRFSWFAAAAYCVLISFVPSTLATSLRFDLAGVPVGLPDLGVALIILGLLAHGAPLRNTSISSPIAKGLVLFLSFSLISAIIGMIHGFAVYSVAIDLRTVAYLLIGYVAVAQIDSLQHDRIIKLLFIIGLVGFVVQQAGVSLHALSVSGGSAAMLENQRDIGVPFWIGKYGLLLAAVMLTRQGMRQTAAVSLFILGAVAMLATFVRTAWLSTMAGLAIILLLAGSKRALKLASFMIVGGMLVFMVLLTPGAGPFVAAVQDRVTSVVSPASPTEDTLGIRIQESQLALSNLRTPTDWLVGVGLGLSVDDPIHPYQHNSFVWLLSKEGVIGLTMFIVVVLLLPLSYAIRGLKATAMARPGWDIAVTLIAVHVANIVSGYASGHLTTWSVLPFTGMTIAWMVKIGSDVAHSPAVIRKRDLPARSEATRIAP